MLNIFGYLLLCLSTLGGYTLAGGHLAALFQPVLFLMVVVASIAVFFAANNALTVKAALAAVPRLLSSDGKASNTLFVLEKVLAQMSKGDLNAARNAAKDEDKVHALTPSVRSYLVESTQLASLPGMTADEFARTAETGLQSHIASSTQIGNALRNLGHITVAVGVMDCLLGFIHAGQFASGSEYMILLSHSMVGAFYGIFVGWGVFLSLGGAIKAKHGLLHTQYRCIDLAMGAHLRGLPPSIAIAAGRKALPPALRMSHSAN